MSLSKLGSPFRAKAKQYLMVSIPDPEAARLTPYETYFEIWLTHSFLKYDRAWLKKYYPAAHVSVKLQVARETTTLTKLARPAEGMVGPGVWANFPITGLLPYGGGIVEIEAGLAALKTDSFLGAAVGVLDDFSGLIVPPVSEALAVANKVSKGVQALLDAGNGEVFLSLHQAYTAPGEGGGENQLQPGYLAVVGATEKELKPNSLTVRGSTLHLREGERTVPLEGYNYLLFRIEGRRERDDWKFPRIEAFIDKARLAQAAGEVKPFERNRDAALNEVLISPDLTPLDRNRVTQAVWDEFREWATQGAGFVGAPTDLEEIVARHAVSVDDPRALSDLTLSELLGDRAAGF